MSDNTQRASVAPFQVRGRFFTAIVLQMAHAPDAAFYDAVDTMLRQTPHFYANAPFVLDLDRAEDIGPSFDFVGLARELRNRKVTLIGVQNGSIEQNKAALHAGLITLPSGTDVLPDSRKQNAAPKEDKPNPDHAINENKRHKESGPKEPQIRQAPVAAYSSATSLLVTEPVRSGQQIFAERGDLVVIASVSPGAELIARGNIHVYGALRGRALAGVHGDNAARIFCEALDAELIAIAGLYKPSEAIDPSLRRRRVQAFLDDGTLCVEPLK
ncbi:MAG TPA: septum site-determining protein MinC [Stellaceae bacterium]|nr:septum site-determining protein MinC [Stellaceae bacterium]